jgi:hypothetical protein
VRVLGGRAVDATSPGGGIQRSGKINILIE